MAVKYTTGSSLAEDGFAGTMKYTTKETVNGKYMRAVSGNLLAVMSQLEWRCHGLGVVQAYLPMGYSPFPSRVHIWNASLFRKEMFWAGRIHDHRFELESTVLAGTIKHSEVTLFPDENAKLTLYEVTAAHEAAPGPDRPKPKQLPGTYSSMASSFIFERGETYRFQKRQFHITEVVSEYAVTVVTKRQEEKEKARIVSRLGEEPVDGFEQPPDRELINRHVNAAVQLLHW